MHLDKYIDSFSEELIKIAAELTTAEQATIRAKVERRFPGIDVEMKTTKEESE